MAGVGQQFRLFCRQRVKIRLHIVEQFAGHDPVNAVPDKAGAAVSVRHTVAEVRGAVPHDALNAEQHGQTLRPRGIGHGGGRVILGTPDMYEVWFFGLQQRREGGGVRRDAVAHAVGLALRLGFSDAENGQPQVAIAAQGGQLPGQPTAADVAGTGQPAGSRRLRQRRFDKPEDLHGEVLLFLLFSVAPSKTPLPRPPV